MVKHCKIKRLDGTNMARVVETFDFDPAKWIPNKAFLKECIPCPEGTKFGYLYNLETGVFENDPEPLIAELPIGKRIEKLESLMDEALARLGTLEGQVATIGK